MKLINLTEEQNEQLKKMHMDAMDSVETLKKIDKMGNPLANELALVAFAQAQAYWELGDFEQDPRIPK